MSPRRNTNYDILASLEELLAAQHTIAAYAEDWDEGFPTTASGDGTGSRPIGSHSDRVANQAVNNADPDSRPVEGAGLADQLRSTLAMLEDVKAMVRQAANDWHRLRPDEHTLAELKVRAADTRSIGVGGCNVAGCDTYCTGGLNDRLKSGYCPRHYLAWWRNLRSDTPLDRTQFIATRMVTVVTPDQPTDVDHPPHVHDGAVQSRLTSDSAPGATGPEAA